MIADPRIAAAVVLLAGAIILAALAKWRLDSDNTRQRRRAVMRRLAWRRNHGGH